MARRKWRAVAVALAVVGTFSLAACGDDDDDSEASAGDDTEETSEPSDAADSVAIKMIDYGYEVGGALKAGGTLEVSNDGKQFHMIGIGKLKQGKTLDDVIAALESLTEGSGEGEEPAGEEGGDGTSLPAPDAGLISLRTMAAADEPATTTEEEPATTEEEPAGEGEGEGEDPLGELVEEMGMPGQIVGPGSSIEVTVPELGSGNYAMICFLNVEGEETPHFSKGMVGELEVVEDEAEALGDVDATYTAVAGEAIEGPAELKAGHNVLKIDVSGEGAGELEPGLVKLGDGVTIEKFAEALAAFDSDGLPKDAASMIPGEFIVGVFDYEDNGTVYLAAHLEPGTYVITAQDSDAEDAPDVPVERIEIKVT